MFCESTHRAGGRIEKVKYDAMVAALLEVIPELEPGVRFTELKELLVPHLPEHIYTEDVSVSWYLTPSSWTLRRAVPLRG